MDTATHFVIGLSIAGLSSIDQTVVSEPALSQAILFGTLIGSQAPDFDGISRLWGGTSKYIKTHRGITHSIPAVFVWPTLIALILNIFYPNVTFSHLWFWTFLSVFTHIFLDIFNAYGTQALRPLSHKWISVNVLNIFDPFVFSVHITGIIFWKQHIITSANIFLAVFTLTLFYLLWRIWLQNKTLKKLRLEYHLKGKLNLLPTIKQNTWNIIHETEDKFNIGVIANNKLEWLESKIKTDSQKIIEASKKDKKVQAFLHVTSYAYQEWKKTSFGYEVRFTDLRYRFNNHYPFLAIVLLDESLKIIDSYAGWVYKEKKINKKIHSLLGE